MQKLIAKYGTAAHLAILAVAPLFLFPFFRDEAIATALLWLSLPAMFWIVLEPSLRSGEMLHNARRRMLRSMLKDPLLWISLVLIVYTAFRALNTGIAMVYDAELSQWHLADPLFPIMPGSVGSSGYLPFATMVSLTIILQGCRHSLGRSARMAFLLVSSTLAGLAAVVAVSLVVFGNATVLSAIKFDGNVNSFVGFAFAFHLIGGTVALLAAFENRWRLVIPLFAFAIGGNAAGLFVFLPAFETLVFAIAEFVVLAYAFAVACRSLRTSGEFKLLVVSGISFTLGGLLVALMLPEKMLDAKIAVFMSLNFLPDSFLNLRGTLSSIALKSWLKHLWVGSGLAAFPLEFQFAATPEDWLSFPMGAQSVSNGWLNLLVERGIVGAVAVLLPFGALAVTFVRRLMVALPIHAMPHPACILFPVCVAVTGAVGCFDSSFMRSEGLMVLCALCAISANSFPKRKRKVNG